MASLLSKSGRDVCNHRLSQPYKPCGYLELLCCFGQLPTPLYHRYCRDILHVPTYTPATKNAESRFPITQNHVLWILLATATEHDPCFIMRVVFPMHMDFRYEDQTAMGRLTFVLEFISQQVRPCIERAGIELGFICWYMYTQVPFIRIFQLTL